MKNVLILLITGLVLISCTKSKIIKDGESIVLSKDILQDKIKGGWAGQVIGCTYGGPTEFKFKGSMIQSYNPIPWNDSIMLWWYKNAPGLYDDVYMDLTFVDVFERYGIDAPADSHAVAYANAEYMLWHANQAGRYNVLNGIMPPMSGHWKNNPHADCIDFQIEADFAGLMSPGMPNYSNSVCDKVGHIMNYGDGWYGGVYVAAMYSLAFVSNEVHYIVSEALNTIPKESNFYKCMSDVILWHNQNPSDWKKTWFEVEKKWTQDISCPDGIFNSFNIDATVNSAYVIIGLLYGDSDYGKTLDISTRCGQDSDCNPATAGGILGTILGYKNIPEYWKQGIDKVENLDFKYTTVSLNDAYKMGFEQSLKVIEKNGGKNNTNDVLIKYQSPKAVQYEKSFPDMYPFDKVDAISINKYKLFEFTFTAKGIVIPGSITMVNKKVQDDYVALIQVSIDDLITDTITMPVNYINRKHEIYWNYDLTNKKHKLTLSWINSDTLKYKFNIRPAFVYGDSLISYVK